MWWNKSNNITHQKQQQHDKKKKKIQFGIMSEKCVCALKHSFHPSQQQLPCRLCRECLCPGIEYKNNNNVPQANHPSIQDWDGTGWTGWDRRFCSLGGCRSVVLGSPTGNRGAGGGQEGTMTLSSFHTICLQNSQRGRFNYIAQQQTSDTEDKENDKNMYHTESQNNNNIIF